ncbi:MAG: FAD:protein FMN transferase [Bacteroidales bacterium]|nr:FAD:protein FMN transferase [Bacteroidales bacterium]
MKKIIGTILLFCLLLAFCHCSQQGNMKRFTFSGGTQGTYYQITYYAADSIVTQTQIQEALDKFLQVASLWDPDSEISRVNRNENVKVGTDFQAIFHEAQEISRLTGGAFDVTVGGLVNAWGFGPHQKADSVLIKIDSLRQYVGYQNVDLIDSEVVKKYPNTKIDFNAIAKGYSVDLMAKILWHHDIDNFLVNIGGEIYASGLKPDGGKWNVGIEKPAETNISAQNVLENIALSNKATATSGTYRNYFVKDSIRYSHTIDPTTGRPVEHTLLSVTVIADRCVTADALATAFMVMGVEKAMEFLSQNPQFDGYFIYCDEDNELQVVYTEGFKNLLI